MIHHPDNVKTLTEVLAGLSLLAVLFATYGYYGTDVWLASTQWMLIANFFLGFAVFLSFVVHKKS